MKKLLVAAVALATLMAPYAFAETECIGTTLTGTVRDRTLALIPEAKIVLDGKRTVVSGADGRFQFACVADGTHHVTASAESFSKREMSISTPGHKEASFVLDLEAVETDVDVSGDNAAASSSATASGPTQTISGKQLQALADDPDDLLRELQQFAAMSGGSPSGATIAVDGFSGGDNNTTLPPKSSIAYIKVNPDLFSSEYREPPFGGGRVEVYTKPGQPTFHGALFATNGSPWMNARDPFSTSKAALGKQRYGFELTGPIRKGSDFTMTLEHRSIDNAAVVNAVTVDGAGDESNIVQNVPTPQRLWVGTARVDWQLGAKNTLIASFNADVNHLMNFGVGGTSLAETGEDIEKFDNTLHLTDVTTISSKLMHEQLLGIEWDGETDTPNSLATQIAVAGAFTGGGATNGAQRLREVDIEDDDDAILSTKNHLMKFGLQSEILNEHKALTTNFNGTYTFGGGILPGMTTPITGLQQYEDALNGLSSGAPTAFSNVAGNPEVDLVQVRFALYFQDSWKIRPNLTAAYGMRYYGQSDATIGANLTPRLGISWSPDKKATWTFHAHAGTFTGRFLAREWGEVLRMDGTQRVTSTIYNPTCSSVSGTSCNPFAGATVVHSIRTVQPKIPNLFFGIENLGFTHAFPKGWNLSGDYYIAQMWHYTRTENINSPLDGSPTGPRPGAANLNVLQLNFSGRGYGNVEFMGLEQHSLKRLQLFMGAVRVDIVDDADNNDFFTPQTTGVNAGEYARRSNNGLWNVFGNAMLTLPEKVQLSGNLNAQGQAAYNITTGFDNNGDGNFNDRPQYATPGTPGAVQTPWGLLVASGGTGSLPRNKGQMPWTFYLDTNLQRAFKLTKNAKAVHTQTLTLNIRSSNVLNHLNVTQVGGVIGSPLFGVPYQADNGRRVEGGVRYSF
jgi:hypothetical protein